MYRSEKPDSERDYLVAAEADVLVMVDLGAVRQSINATYVDSTAELVDDTDYYPAFVCPLDDHPVLKAIVAVPDDHRVSVVPYPGKFDWQCQVIKYHDFIQDEEGYVYPVDEEGERVL